MPAQHFLARLKHNFATQPPTIAKHMGQDQIWLVIEGRFPFRIMVIV